MTDIDPEAEIGVQTDAELTTARILITGDVTEAWRRRYQLLAHSAGIPAQADRAATRTIIVVKLPRLGGHREIARTMDAARALIAVTDAATQQAPQTASAEASVRDWWDRRRITARRKPITRVEAIRTGIGSESRLTLIAALAAAFATLLLLPARFSVGPNWLTPTIEAVLLVAILIVDAVGGVRRSAEVRYLSVTLVLVLVAEAAFVTVRLVVDLVEGGPETGSAADLLRVGFGVWVYTIIAFAFLYWLLDNGGANARIWQGSDFPDLAFPQHLNRKIAPPGWRPSFADYLYLGFTDATAFSPTDVMPLARWAKLAMAVQAFASLAIVGLVIARAVNIFK